MQPLKQNRKVQAGVVLAALVITASLVAPAVSGRSNPAEIAGAGSVSQTFPTIQDGLTAFSLVCLTNGKSFSSKKSDLMEVGATRATAKTDTERLEIISPPGFEGSFIFTSGDNYEACGLTLDGDYLEAEEATNTWFFRDRKSSHFFMFMDHQNELEASIAANSHIWKLESPDQNRVNLVQIKEMPTNGDKTLTSLSHTIIDFNK